MIDTHAHLSDPAFEADLDEVIERAKASGVEKILCPTTNLTDAKRMVEIVAKYSNIYGLVGLYPGEAKNNPNWKRDLRELKEILLSNRRVVGIGEIGIDQASYELDPLLEKEVFETQLEMGLELDCPVVIHTRNTGDVVEKILKKYPRVPRGHFHCFSGSKEWLEYVLSRGFYVGFDGNVTYKNATNLRELAAMVPKERLLLETDSPYLPPQGKRGERNEPDNVRITAEFIANLRGESLSELERYTSDNAIALFNLYE